MLKKKVSDKKKDIAFSFPFEIIKAEEVKIEGESEGRWIVEGYAGTSDLDLQGDVILEDAFKNAEKDLIENSTVLYNHDIDNPIGKVEEVKAQKEGLWVKVFISKTASKIWQQITEGVINKFSIRGKVLKDVKEYVAKLKKVAHVIKEMYLLECSLVTLPANTKAKTLNWYVEKALREVDVDYEANTDPDIRIGFKSYKEVKDRMKKFLISQEALEAIKSTIKTLLERVAEGDEDTKSLLNSVTEKAIGEEFNDAKKYTQEELDKKIEETVGNKKFSQEEVDKMVADAKKSVDGKYSQEEVDKMVADAKKSLQEEMEKKIEEAKKSAEKDKTETVEPLEKKITELDDKLKDMEATARMEKQWIGMKDKYKKEDANDIKAILLKAEKGIVLTPNETIQLIDKQIRVGLFSKTTEVVDSNELTEEKKAELRKLGGIKGKVVEK